MPSEKKRINLTMPDDLYEKLQDYKSKKFVASDAAACLQLIAKQLDGWKATAKLLKALQNLSQEDLELVCNGRQVYLSEGELMK